MPLSMAPMQTKAMRLQQIQERMEAILKGIVSDGTIGPLLYRQ